MAIMYSIYDTKTRLSELLRQVKNGKPFIITERGQPIARVVPYQATISLSERISALGESGQLHCSKQRDRDFPQVDVDPAALRRFLLERE